MNNSISKKIIGVFSKKKKALKELLLVKKIRVGFKKNEFKMHLQFIVENKTKKIVSAEALSRWEDSAGGVIFPGEYIGVMERSGIIVKFDYYMFEKVCQKLAEWKGTEFDSLTISCNLTRITICDNGFISKIKKIADKYDFDRRRLLIEITEDSIEKDMKIARENVIKIKDMGFRIAIDDIGSGYTSMKNLGDYPVDVVKIDRDVLLMTEEESGKLLFNGIVSLIHSLGKKAVCEGVETVDQNDFVSASECDYIQGWYYTKALPEGDAENFVREYMKKV